MKNYTVCILDKDIHYAKAFMKVVALEHAGFCVGARSACGENCPEEIDVCIGFGPRDEAGLSCEKAFEPACGKYAGAAAILSEVKKFILDRDMACGKGSSLYAGKMSLSDGSSVASETLICVHAYAGGLGTSCAAIGIGRELSRYRGESVLYISLEDVEDAGLFPQGLHAMRAEEALYRYFRLLNTGAGQEGFGRLFRAATARDEYSLYRVEPDEGTGSFAGLASDELYIFLTRIVKALGLNRVVLDFGTRLHFLESFAAYAGQGEAFLIEVRHEGDEYTTGKQTLFADERSFKAVFPVCEEDVRRKGRHTDVGVANAFGLAVKEICDRIIGDKK